MLRDTEEDIFKDVLGALDYFGARATPGTPNLRVVGTYDPIAGLALPWKSVRRPALNLSLLVALPEPTVPGFPTPPPPQEPEDLYLDKIERQVASLEPGVAEESTLRTLLVESPQGASRIAIQRLLEEGLTPRQILRAKHIRRRCRSVFLEFNRIDLWGPKFCASEQNQTVGWKLATRLLQAGICSRQELFHYFRHLSDRYQTDSALRYVYHGVLDFAERTLPQRHILGGVDKGPCPEKRWTDTLASLSVKPLWCWQDPRSWRVTRLGNPHRDSIIAATKESPPSCCVAVAFYRACRVESFGVLRNQAAVESFLSQLILQEGPITYARARRFYRDITNSDEDVIFGRALDKLRKEKEIKQIGFDYWHSQNLPHRDRVPRIPDEWGVPEYRQASCFDVGLGYTRFCALRPNSPDDLVEMEFLNLWGRRKIKEDDLGALRIEVRDFQRLYKKWGFVT